MSDSKNILILFLENLRDQAALNNKHYITLSEKTSSSLMDAVRYITLAARESGKFEAFQQIIDLLHKS